jgi:hypothetical protein
LAGDQTAANHGFNGGKQGFRGFRFYDASVDSGRKPAAMTGFAAHETDDPEAGTRPGQFADEIKGVAFGKVKVQQEDVWLHLRDGAAGHSHPARLTATGQRGLLVEPMNEAAAEKEVILHHEHADLAHRSGPANLSQCKYRRQIRDEHALPGQP